MFFAWIVARVRAACWKGVEEFAAEFDAVCNGTEAPDLLPPALRQRLMALPAPEVPVEDEVQGGRKRKGGAA